MTVTFKKNLRINSLSFINSYKPVSTSLTIELDWLGFHVVFTSSVTDAQLHILDDFRRLFVSQMYAVKKSRKIIKKYFVMIFCFPDLSHFFLSVLFH
jgi:hypothetical protein